MKILQKQLDKSDKCCCLLNAQDITNLKSCIRKQLYKKQVNTTLHFRIFTFTFSITTHLNLMRLLMHSLNTFSICSKQSLFTKLKHL